MTCPKTPLPAEVKLALRGSIFRYLHNAEEATPFALREATKVSTYNGLVQTQELPAGTEGWLFAFPQRSYSAYQWVGDEQYPAPGATITESGCSYQWVTLVEREGRKVLADAFKTVEYAQRRVVGKVAA